MLHLRRYCLTLISLFLFSHISAQCPDTFIGCKADVVVSLETSGTATVTPDDVTGFALDPLAIYTVTPNTFTCADVGSIIEYTFTITCPTTGQMNLCMGNFTIEDNVIPIITCPDPVIITLDEDGMAEYTPAYSVDDNCEVGVETITFILDCTTLGEFTSGVFFTDVGGNEVGCDIVTTIVDNSPPIPNCNAVVTGDLMGSSTYVLNPADVDLGSYDNCSISSMQLSQVEFTSADIGANTVDLYFMDDSGNEDFCTFTLDLINSVYAESEGSNTSFEYIKKVKLRQINNRSNDDGGYGDYTDLSTRLQTGRTYNLKLNPGFNGPTYEENWNAWIDWNQNKVFESGELIYSGSSASNIVSPITVPASAINGPTQMRVSMRWGDFAGPEETFLYGEVEDYSIDVQGGIIPLSGGDILDELATSNPIGGEMNIFPNPATTIINLEGIQQNDQLFIYDFYGQLIAQLNPQNQSYRIDELKSQGYYIIRIREDGSKEIKKFIKIN